MRDTLRPVDDTDSKWGPRVLLALGVLSVLALPALTGAFALRLDDAFGVHYAPLDVRARDTDDGAFVLVRVDALKADDEQDFWFDEGRAVLHAEDGTVDAATVSADGCRPARVTCARTVTLAFPVSEDAFAGAWSIRAHLSWLSRDVRVTSGHDVTFHGEGLAFA